MKRNEKKITYMFECDRCGMTTTTTDFDAVPTFVIGYGKNFPVAMMDLCKTCEQDFVRFIVRVGD